LTAVAGRKLLAGQLVDPRPDRRARTVNGHRTRRRSAAVSAVLAVVTGSVGQFGKLTRIA